MSVPKYHELYRPLLAALQDGEAHTMMEVRAAVAENLHLTGDDLAEMVPSGTQSVFACRIGWAKTYLLKAEMIESPQRGRIRITPSGEDLLDSNAPISNALLSQRSTAFQRFYPHKSALPSATDDDRHDEDTPETPQETFDRVYTVINDQLADDLLAEILEQNAAFFERLVVNLMKAMGYGDGFVTKLSGDDGIDGIIYEDRLGFSLIYIQAKRWRPDITIGKPDLQKFAGAMMGPPKVDKGLFITTAKFSQKAREFAEAQHIILVDGKKLTELMIECDVGVSTQKVYRIKRVDSDYFFDN